MTTTTLARSFLLVAALGYSNAESNPKPTVAAAEPAPSPAPIAPTATTTSFIQLASELPADSATIVDAKSLGSSVNAYLVERAGGDTGDGTRAELALVVSSPTGRRVVELSSYVYSPDAVPAFGALTPFPALSVPRPYSAKLDGFEDAKKFRSKAPLLFKRDVRTYPGDDRYYRITHDGDALVVWLGEDVYEEGPQPWTKIHTIKLARKATVATPALAANDTTPRYTAASPLKVVERVEGKNPESYAVAFDLVVGNARGPLGTCSVAKKFTGEHAWTASKLSVVPAPTKGTVLATRLCDGDNESYTLERRGNQLVLWRGLAVSQPSDWIETELVMPQ